MSICDGSNNNKNKFNNNNFLILHKKINKINCKKYRK